MKLLGGVAGALVGLAVVAFIAYYVWPGVGRLNAQPSGTPARQGPSDLAPDRDPQRVAPPTTPEERTRTDLNVKRQPLYAALRANGGDLLDGFQVGSELDTLDVVVRRADDPSLMAVLSEPLAGPAWRYGFRHVRFMVRQWRGATDYTPVIAEASLDDANRWHIYRK